MSLKSGEHSLKRVLLVEPHVCVSVSVLDADDEIADDTHAGAVSKEFLVGALGVIFLRLEKLVVKVEVVFLPGLQLSCGEEGLHKQSVEFVRRVEVIVLARVRCIGDIVLLELAHDAEHRVRTARTQVGMLRKFLYWCEFLRFH